MELKVEREFECSCQHKNTDTSGIWALEMLTALLSYVLIQSSSWKYWQFISMWEEEEELWRSLGNPRNQLSWDLRLWSSNSRQETFFFFLHNSCSLCL